MILSHTTCTYSNTNIHKEIFTMTQTIDHKLGSTNMMTSSKTVLLRALDAISQAEQDGLMPGTENSVLSGYSGNKLVGTLQRLTRIFKDDPTACYLEVGVFQGLTLLSVANATKTFPCFGIDNFAKYDPHKHNQSIVDQRIKSLSLSNANLINSDYEDAFDTLDTWLGGKKLAVYFIDGPHDYRSQLMCLELAVPYLHQDAIILVDDSNYQHVRQANRDFLKTHPEYKLLFDSYTDSHPMNMSKEDEAIARKGWWDGINILVRDSSNQLPVSYPPTERSRRLFENENDLQAMRTAEIAPQAALMIQSILELNLFRFAVNGVRFAKEAWTSKGMWMKRFRVANTYSKDLPRSRYNRPK